MQTRAILLFLLLCVPTYCTVSCNLPMMLTQENLDTLADGCIEVIGNLQMNRPITESSLIQKFKNVTKILGCINIADWIGLETLAFMSNVRVINCTIEEGNKNQNVIELNSYSIRSLKWDSLETIIGPGIIHLKDFMCLSLHEIEIFLLHPQYHGDEWTMHFRPFNCQNEGCSVNYPIVADSFDLTPPPPPPPDLIQIATGCRVLIGFNLTSAGFMESPLLDKLKDVRIILGGFHIENSFLTNLSFFSNVELIYTTGSSREFPIRLIGNKYMTDISLPKLRQFKSSMSPSVAVEGSPLLPNTNPYINVTNLFVEKVGFSSHDPTTTILGSTNFVRITSRKRLDGSAHMFNLVVYGMYYPPIAISIIFNLRAVTLFCFGTAKYSLGGLRWCFTALAVVHLLIASDSAIFYHDLALAYFTPAPLLPNIILYSDALLVFCKTMFVLREIVMDIPLASGVYIFMAMLMTLTRQSMRITTYIFFLGVVAYGVSTAHSLYSTLEIRARRTLNIAVDRIGAFPMDKYAIIAGINGNFSVENFAEDLGTDHQILNFEKTVYTDGLDMTYTKQMLEYAAIGLFGIYLMIKLFDRRDRLAKLPNNYSIIVILIQYSVLRYAPFRNHVIRTAFPISCWGNQMCAEKYSFDHTLTMITHHGVYVLMSICSCIVWYTARYFHFLGAIVYSETRKEDAINEGRSEL